VNKTITLLVWDRCPTKFSGSQLVVLLKLAASSSREARCYLHVDDLKRACGVKKRSLQYITKKLRKAGVLHVQERKGLSNCYTLNLDEIRKLPRVKARQPVDSTADDLERVGATDCTL
jgi:hypothetical protein